MTILYPGHEVPPLQELDAKPCNWRLTAPKTIKMLLLRPLMTNVKMTVRDAYAFSAYNRPPPPTLSINALTPCLAFGQVSTTLPIPVASIWNKVNFPFHQPGLFFDFWVAAMGSHTYTFGNAYIPNYLIFGWCWCKCIMFLISNSTCSFLVYRKVADSYIWTLYPATLL